ncbi:MAG: hypothetical protein ACLTMP_12490 [Eggerthella lenta]
MNMIGFCRGRVAVRRSADEGRQAQPPAADEAEGALKKQLKLGADVPLVVCSSEKGTGIDELRSLIKNSVR